jgi:hypothetical protein
MDPALARCTRDDGLGERWRWIGFHMRNGEGLEGMLCAAHFADGSAETGVFDANHVVGWGRSNNSVCTRLELLQHVFQDGPSVADALLAALVD